MKVVFMGSSNFSLPFLQKLIDNNYDILCVYTKSPYIKRNKILKNPIHILSEKNNIPVYTEIDNMFDILYDINPQKVIVASYGNILSKNIVEIFDCINIHASLLPMYRGSSPIQTSLLNGDNISGVTIIKMDKGMDTGNIIAKETVDISIHDDYLSLENKLSYVGSKLLLETINYKEVFEQTYILPPTRILSKTDGLIDWNKNSIEIYNKVRALKYNPKVFFYHNDIRYNVYNIEIQEENYSSITPGTILDDKLTIKTKNGSISILEIQQEGKNILNVSDFLNGNKKLIKNIVLQ